jgi:ribosome maturation factor RimP
MQGTPHWEKLKSLASEVCQREGCTLYDLEFVAGSKGKGRTLRVYIDRLGAGVSVQDCTNVSRGLSLLLDVEDLVEGGAYTLEVSSPGLERVLREPWHFESALGERVEVRAKESLDQFNPDQPNLKNRNKVTGVLKSVNGEHVMLEVDGNEVKVPFSALFKGRKIVPFEVKAGAPSNKGKKLGKNKEKR